MPISVTCPNTCSKPGLLFSGFSLLELMVVLVLLGGITSLALPNLTRLYDSISLKLERDAIVTQLQSLGGVAMANRQAIILPMDEVAEEKHQGPSGNYVLHALDLPLGWHVELDRDLIVRANGVCLGAEVSIFHLGEKYAFIELKPPYCSVEG